MILNLTWPAFRRIFAHFGPVPTTPKAKIGNRQNKWKLSMGGRGSRPDKGAGWLEPPCGGWGALRLEQRHDCPVLLFFL